MKKVLRVSLTAIALLLVFNALTVTDAKAQTIVTEILKRMETHRNSLTSLRASVTMVKYDSVLKDSDTTEGTTSYLPAKGKDAYVRIDWTKPANEILAVANGKYVLYRPRLKQALVGNSKNAQGNGKASNALAFMNMSKAELKANYTVVYLGQENVSGGSSTWHLQLTPKTKSTYKSAKFG